MEEDSRFNFFDLYDDPEYILRNDFEFEEEGRSFLERVELTFQYPEPSSSFNLELPGSIHGMFSFDENLAFQQEDEPSYTPQLLQATNDIMYLLADDFQINIQNPDNQTQVVDDSEIVDEGEGGEEEEADVEKGDEKKKARASSLLLKKRSRSLKTPETLAPVSIVKKVPIWYTTPGLKKYDKRTPQSQISSSSTFLEAIAYMFESPSFSFPKLNYFKRGSPNLESFVVVSPNHRNKLDAERHLQFPEFEDRTFELLGSSDEEKISKFIPSPRRGVRISNEDLRNLTSDQFRRIQFVDARFNYEYNEGTVGYYEPAINIDEFWNLEKILATLWDSTNNYAPRFQGKTLVIFCEFSSLRGPGLYRNITIIDHVLLYSRIIAGEQNRSISYPEIYILDGGFSELFNSFNQDLPPFGTNRASLIVNPQNENTAGDYKSEFHEDSDPQWTLKKNYMMKKSNYTPFFERNGLSLIWPIWDPFKANEKDEDFFLILKRNIGYASRNQPIPSASGSSKIQRINAFIQ